MSYSPMFRETLRLLKSKRDAEMRITKINGIVCDIYINTVKLAETTGAKMYAYPEVYIFENNIQYKKSDDEALSQFILENIVDIMNNLRELFPDSKIDYKSLGVIYNNIIEIDIEKIDWQYIPTKRCIVIDWS